jgi:hypothetical protein
VKLKAPEKLVPLWQRFEKSGSIQAYLRYHKAKQVKPKAKEAVAAKAQKAG